MSILDEEAGVDRAFGLLHDAAGMLYGARSMLDEMPRDDLLEWDKKRMDAIDSPVRLARANCYGAIEALLDDHRKPAPAEVPREEH
jgi:hypothetical protein